MQRSTSLRGVPYDRLRIYSTSIPEIPAVLNARPIITNHERITYISCTANETLMNENTGFIATLIGIIEPNNNFANQPNAELILPLFLGYKIIDNTTPPLSNDSSPQEEKSHKSILSNISKTTTLNPSDPLNNISDITYQSSSNSEGKYTTLPAGPGNNSSSTSSVTIPEQFPSNNDISAAMIKDTMPPSLSTSSLSRTMLHDPNANKLPALMITGITSIMTNHFDTAADILRRGSYGFNLPLSVLRLGCFDINTNCLVTNFTLDFEHSNNVPLKSLIGYPHHRLVILPTTAPPTSMVKCINTPVPSNAVKDSASETDSTNSMKTTNTANNFATYSVGNGGNSKSVHFPPSPSPNVYTPKFLNTSSDTVTSYNEPSPYPVATLFPDNTNSAINSPMNTSTALPSYGSHIPSFPGTPLAPMNSASSVYPSVGSSPYAYPSALMSPMSTPYSSASYGPYKASTPFAYSSGGLGTLNLWTPIPSTPMVSSIPATIGSHTYASPMIDPSISRAYAVNASFTAMENNTSGTDNIPYSSYVASNPSMYEPKPSNYVPNSSIEYNDDFLNSSSDVTKADSTSYVKSLVSRLSFDMVILRHQVLFNNENGNNQRTCYLEPLDWTNPMMRDLSMVLSQMVHISYNAQDAQASKLFPHDPSLATTDFETVRTVLFENGAVPILLQAIRYLNPNDRLGRQALEDTIQIICNIGYNHAAQSAMAAPSLNMMEILFARMRLDIGNSEICLKIARCITVLTYQNSGAQLQAVNNGGIEVALQALERHNSHPFAVRKMLQLLESLSYCSDAGIRLVRGKAMDMLTNIRNQSWFRKSYRDDKFLRQAIIEVENCIFEAMNHSSTV